MQKNPGTDRYETAEDLLNGTTAGLSLLEMLAPWPHIAQSLAFLAALSEVGRCGLAIRRQRAARKEKESGGGSSA